MMRGLLRRLLKVRPGSALAIFAVFLPATLGTMALAIDLGMLFQARVQAQRAADAAALAGASHYLDHGFDVTIAEQRARDAAAQNDIRGVLVDPDAEVTVNVITAEFKVYAHVRRTGIPTWFARFLGIETGNVAADATAEAINSGGVDCLRPLAIPDYWHDADNDNGAASGHAGNGIWDYDEQWTFTPSVAEFYSAFGSGNSPETGFGSDRRNWSADPVVNDYGAQLIMKQPQGGNNNETSPPGWFYPLRLDGLSGASDYSNAFTECAEGQYFVGDTIMTENGAMIGPTIDGVSEAIATDPDSYWDAGTNDIANSDFDDYKENPRVLLLALFDPHQLATLGGNTPLIPNNFAHFYLEGFRRLDGTVCTTKACADEGNYKGAVVGRFMYYAQGIGENGATGPLIKAIRLVQ